MIPEDMDRTMIDGHLVEWNAEHGGWDFICNLRDMPPVQRVAVVIDATAALGLPEVIYRTNLWEDAHEAAERLHEEVTMMARLAVDVSIDVEQIAKHLVRSRIRVAGEKISLQEAREIATAIKKFSMGENMVGFDD